MLLYLTLINVFLVLFIFECRPFYSMRLCHFDENRTCNSLKSFKYYQSILKRSKLKLIKKIELSREGKIGKTSKAGHHRVSQYGYLEPA